MMWGPPEDVEGECNARLYLADDYGDNSCTVRCQLLPGHEGPHKEAFKRQDKPVVITWFIDEGKEKYEFSEEWEEERNDEETRTTGAD